MRRTYMFHVWQYVAARLKYTGSGGRTCKYGYGDTTPYLVPQPAQVPRIPGISGARSSIYSIYSIYYVERRDDRGVPYHAESTLSSAQVLKKGEGKDFVREGELETNRKRIGTGNAYEQDVEYRKRTSYRRRNESQRGSGNWKLAHMSERVRHTGEGVARRKAHQERQRDEREKREEADRAAGTALCRPKRAASSW